ncbi:methylaspartate mutase [Streptomyces glaucosporus]|uniref:Methylaspartate mutase n=1 Tax=Streptomyces glaucosporus TaxID=284044 RepID=A0ABN3HTU5_9ACTN
MSASLGRTAPTGSFAAAVAAARSDGELVVQPRMGFPTVAQMGAGLRAVHDTPARTVGTITLDSYTRVGDHASAARALRNGEELNGFPIVAHGGRTTRRMIAAAGAGDFAIQVRHGSPLPLGIVQALVDAGLDATEGGPVSYCLPYSRTPLAEAVDAWARSCELLAERVPGAHLESFGGCMLGQLCPPSLLVALSVLEGIFFRRHGLRSISLSYAQQTSFPQDVAALAALRRLAGEYLGDTDWHVVLYTYMGVFPRTVPGALALLRESARLAALTGTERLIVKTVAEAHRIPTVEDNIHALETASEAARTATATPADHPDEGEAEEIHAEARDLVEAVLELHGDIDRAIPAAFARGYLDIPYCLHADNAQRARSHIDSRGRLRWSSAGRMPVRSAPGGTAASVGADELLAMLSHVQKTFDREALDPAVSPEPLPAAGRTRQEAK